MHLQFTYRLFFMQMNDEIYKNNFKTLYQRVTTSTTINARKQFAGKITSSIVLLRSLILLINDIIIHSWSYLFPHCYLIALCEAATYANPTIALQQFVPYYYNLFHKNIHPATASTSTATTKEGEVVVDLSDDEMIWHLTLFSRIVRFGGSKLLNYQKQIAEIVRYVTSSRYYKERTIEIDRYLSPFCWFLLGFSLILVRLLCAIDSKKVTKLAVKAVKNVRYNSLS